MTTIREEMNRATRELLESGVDSPQLDAEVLMSRVIGKPRIFVIAHDELQLEQNELDRFRSHVERRKKREPLAYIIGTREFWGLDFDVASGVLVPRPDTEILVETALSKLIGVSDPLVVDVGAGTGCIAISIAVELPDAVVYTTDLNPIAIELAERNAIKHDVEIRVPVIKGDLLDGLPEKLKGKLDALVSNPPYIPSDEIDDLQPEVAIYEPRGALDGGSDGLKYIRLILEAAREYLRPGGWMILEVGMGQAEAVIDYAHSLGYVEIEVKKDLAEIERVVSARVD